MTDLTVFKNEEFGQVRTAQINGQTMFVASDVCKVLDIKNVSQAVKKLDHDERSMLNIGRQGNVHVINEYGLYELILVSKKPQAKAFKRWITHEVIPQIRQTGAYQIEQASVMEYNRNIQRLMNRNDELERKWEKAVPYIKLGAVAYELAKDIEKTELTYAFVQGLKSND